MPSSHNKSIYLVHYLYLLLPINILLNSTEKSRSFCLSSIFCSSSTDSGNIILNFLFCSRWYSNCSPWKTSNYSAIALFAFLLFFFPVSLVIYPKELPQDSPGFRCSAHILDPGIVDSASVQFEYSTAEKWSHYFITVSPKKCQGTLFQKKEIWINVFFLQKLLLVESNANILHCLAVDNTNTNIVLMRNFKGTPGNSWEKYIVFLNMKWLVK